MNILIVSATHFEVRPLIDSLGIAHPSIGMNNASVDFESKKIQLLITGVGMVNTALMLSRHVHHQFDLVINAGVCGAFDRNFQLGELVRISEDVLSEMGAENGEEFLTYDKLGLSGKHIFSENCKDDYFMVELLKKVKGITVNTIHGNEISIKKVKQLYSPDVETMEGAAFFAACSGIKANYLQVRAISNYVEKRDKEKWQMPLAIQNLNDFLITFIKNV